MGRRLPDRRRPGRARGPGAPGPTTGWSFTGPMASEVLVDTTRPELLPACVALVAHPDDARFAACSGARCGRRCSASRCRCSPTPWPSPTRGRAWPWSAPSATRPTWCGGASSGCRCGRWSAGTAGCSAARAGRAPTRRPPPLRVRAGRPDGPAGPDPDRRAPRRRRRLRGEPQPIQHAVKFYEKGDRPLEIVTSRQWFFRTLAHRPALLERGRQLRWHPPYMQARYDNWVEGLNTRLADQPPAVLRGAVPGVVPVGRRGPPDYDDPLLRTKPTCRSIRPPTARRGSPRPSGGGQAASSPTRT